MEKKISVVIPTYNRPALLLKCLKALEVQTLAVENYEVIVVHDGPEDQVTLQGIATQNFCFKLTLLHTEYKKGPAAARNLGWLQARHPLIAFTDDDCLPDENWLEALLEAYHNEPLVAYSGKTIVPIPDQPTDFDQNTAGLETAEFITANSACTKQALIKVGGFDERFGMAWREDSDLEFKFIVHKITVRRNNMAVVIHPVRAANWGVSLKEQKKGLYDVLLFKKYPQLYRQKIQARPLWNYYAVLFLWITALLAAGTGNRTIAKLAAILMLIPIGLFFFKRVKSTRKSALHMTEMLFTSLLIPFLSVYWRGYGIIKFRKLLF